MIIINIDQHKKNILCLHFWPYRPALLLNDLLLLSWRAVLPPSSAKSLEKILTLQSRSICCPSSLLGVHYEKGKKDFSSSVLTTRGSDSVLVSNFLSLLEKLTELAVQCPPAVVMSASVAPSLCLLT